jgi:hypothetical protein
MDNGLRIESIIIEFSKDLYLVNHYGNFDVRRGFEGSRKRNVIYFGSNLGNQIWRGIIKIIYIYVWCTLKDCIESSSLCSIP